MYTELCTLNKKRGTRLVESRKFYKFIREAEDVAEWIGDQTTVAASEDYGRDVEHVELLIQVSYLPNPEPIAILIMVIF